MKNKKILIRHLARTFMVFLIVTITVSGIAVYRLQMNIYKELCAESIKNVGDYLTRLMLRDGDDFVAYSEYYAEHCSDIRIPKDFDEYETALTDFMAEFSVQYPGKTWGVDVAVRDLPDDLKNLYFTYKQEYWLLTFEHARESFNLPYTYFLTMDDENYRVVYMIDGERTEDPEHPGYLYMGDSYDNPYDKYKVMWETWFTGQKQADVLEFDNSWGHTYSYYTPLIINGQKIGLVAAEIEVADVDSGIMASTLALTARLALILIALTAVLIFFIDHLYIKRINFLSQKIDDFSTTRASEVVEAIRGYKFGHNEISALADNTADMITEIKEHERELQKASDMKSDFLANMSHEIRTPMNAVIGMSELILREDISPRARNYASQIRTSGNALVTIINDILDFSKIESGNMDIIVREYEPARLVEEVSGVAALNLKGKYLDIKTDINPTLPAVLRGDNTRIRQVLTNLVDNAVKFTKEGSVEISADYEKIDERKIMLKLEVTDTGIGIERENLDKIFESFMQVNSTRNRDAEGTGLGLAISKRLVDLMGGTLSVESEFGKGSVFTIEIPQELPEANPDDNISGKQALNKASEFSAPEAKVLVVDDNQVNIFIMNGLLEGYDIRPIGVLSGEEAIEEAGKTRYDIVFMDHMMPGMDGVEAMHEIRKRYPEYEKVPMIAFTANAVEDAREMLLREGMNDFLPKPVEGATLLKVLRKWIPKDKVQFKALTDK